MVNDPTVRVPASTPASAARPTSIRYLVVLLIALCSSSAYLTRYCISVANTTIEADLSLTPEQMGWILAMFNAGYFFFQVPGGALGTRFGTRVSLPLLSTLWSIFTVWTSLVSTYIPLMASRIAFGAAQAGLVPNSAKGVSDWLPIERKGFGSASIGAAMSVGGAVTMGMTGLLLERFDWRTLFQLYSLVGIVWAGGYYLIARSRPGEHPRVNKAELDLIEGRISGEETSPEETSPKARELTREVVVRLARSRNMWFICGQAAFRAAGYGLFVTWFPAFLEKGYGVTREDAGLKTMAPLFGVIVGTMLGGFLVDALLKRTRSKKISRSGVALTALALCGCFTLFSLVDSLAESVGGRGGGRRDLLRAGQPRCLGRYDGCRRRLHRRGYGHHEHGGHHRCFLYSGDPRLHDRRHRTHRWRLEPGDLLDRGASTSPAQPAG